MFYIKNVFFCILELLMIRLSTISKYLFLHHGEHEKNKYHSTMFDS